MVETSLLSHTERTAPRDIRHVYPFPTWTEDTWEFLRQASYEVEDALFREPGYTEFEVGTLRLPVVSERWKVVWAGHPRITFEDLRTGRLPKPTRKELAQRQEAIRLAQEIRARLDIRPLTTSTIIRQLREGTEEE